MKFPDNWFPIFDVTNGDVAIKSTMATGDNPLTGDKELNDLLHSAIVGGELRFILGT